MGANQSHDLNEKNQTPENAASALNRKCPFTAGLEVLSKATPQTQNGADPPSSPSLIGELPLELIETLPIILYDRTAKLKRGDTITQLDQTVEKIDNGDNFEKHFKADLDFRRLNSIHDQLWMCGRPINARPLHQHLLLGRQIVVAERADYHLLTFSDIIMVKPLPSYLLYPDVWTHYLCKDKELYESARGLLLSYIWIIRSEHDFKIAKHNNHSLLPESLTWQLWRQVALDSIDKFETHKIDADTLENINKRFQFGELRLGRINKIYRIHPRFFLGHFVRGYMYGYNRYAPFFQRNVSWILGGSVLFSLVLSAMQVGVAVDPLMQMPAFKHASYGFVVFVCLLVAVVLVFVTAVFSVIYLFNMGAAIRHAYVQQRDRKELAEYRRLTKHIV